MVLNKFLLGLVFSFGITTAVVAQTAPAPSTPMSPTADKITANQSGAPKAASIDNIFSGEGIDHSLTAIPFSPGAPALGLYSGSFGINYGPTVYANSDAFQVYRTDTSVMSGGPPGNTTSAFRAYMYSPAGATYYSWTGTFVNDNHNTVGDGSQNAALIGYLNQYGNGIGIASNIAITDFSGNANPTTTKGGLEIDNVADLTDANSARYVLNLWAERHGSTGITTITNAILIDSDANSQYDYILNCSGATIVSACVRMADGMAIDFASNLTGSRVLYHQSSCLNYRDNGTILYKLCDDGGIVLGAPTGGDMGAGTINLAGNYYINGVAVGGGGGGTVTTSGSPAAGNMAEFSASTVIGPDVGGGTLGGPTGGQEGAGTINVKNGYYLNGSQVNVVPFSSSCTFGACTYTLPGITDTLLGAGTVESISQLYTFSAGLTVSGGTLTDSSSTLALFSNGLNVGNNKCISSPGNPNNLCLVMDSSNGNGFLTGLYFNYNAAIRGLDCGAGGAGNNSASSGLFACNYMSATIAQTGTAGWAALDVNPTISSSGSGHADAIVVHHGSTRYAGITYSGLVFTKGFTVSTLPTAASQDQGSRAFVTDQLTACVVAGAALTGGGSVVCPVFDNGSAWVGD